MKILHKPILFAGSTLLATVVGISSVSALGAKAATTNTTNTQQLQKIISRGDSEISRRITTLNNLTSKISAAKHLSSSDQAALSSEVNGEVSNLTALKTKLDADTDVTTAKSDAQSIITDYRVYALIVPKVELIKAADDEITTAQNLATLEAKLQTRITAAQTAGKDVTSLQTTLNDMTSKSTAASTIATNVQTAVINLLPTDYNSNHSVLGGDRDQLKTARADLQAAHTDGQTIVNGLKSLGTN